MARKVLKEVSDVGCDPPKFLAMPVLAVVIKLWTNSESASALFLREWTMCFIR